ncbi:CDP-diacylglycerol--inositol 3-phosphatidyltransferase-like isoform X2 [Corticium candelabrum]|uniref:CDP-diacylglycerol--inositol 3-phosphatidyltransferase-like isoform X2 n=1 Tax=Corticium candelabrum TaxID=121492 RepID=UPI002E270A9A|nr:CDP-diacylglycerol--inositol 3-phosphatidyltransferase-like isoform X2 [Corticium candelabrum]
MLVTSTEGKVNVFLFIPNLVGYVRLVCLFIALMIMNGLVGDENPGLAVAFYMASVLLDEVDGMAARKFKQESRLGAMLDLLTDRCGTICLFMTLTHCYPVLTMLFQVLATVDIFSHWFLAFSSVLANKSSHKTVNKYDVNILLWVYYNNSLFLSCMNIGHESFLLLLYMLNFSSGPTIGIFGLGIWNLLACLLLLIAIVKQVIHIMQQ